MLNIVLNFYLSLQNVLQFGFQKQAGSFSFFLRLLLSLPLSLFVLEASIYPSFFSIIFCKFWSLLSIPVSR